MSTPTFEELTSDGFAKDLTSLPIEEIRRRRGMCQDAEEALSLRRRLIQGRLDIVQAELYRRAGGGSAEDVSHLVAALPSILVEHGDRHLGPGRLTSLETDNTNLGADFDAFLTDLDGVVDGNKLTDLATESDAGVRAIADQLDDKERGVSEQRRKLHGHIDAFQEEIVRRYKSGEASVDSLLGQ